MQRPGVFRVGRTAAWIDCHRPHAHWAAPAEPWELYWIRIDGRQTRLFARSSAVGEVPVFRLRDAAAAESAFRQIFALLNARPLAIDAALHAAVAGLIALLFEARLLDAPAGERGSGKIRADLKMRGVLASLRRNYQRPWRVEELAHLSGLSVPHFYRRFRQATGSPPLDWLRRERINQAKRRLSESPDRIREIAAQVGYRDQFYFSRDFKKLVGLSPRHYRQQEHAKPASPKS